MVDRRRARGAGGQVVPLLAALLLVTGLVGVGLVELAATASRRAAATAAADAAALAGAAEGRPAAAVVARENGARLLAYREVGADVTVTVERRGVRASARARWSGGSGLPDGGTDPPSRRPSRDDSPSGSIPYTRPRG